MQVSRTLNVSDQFRTNNLSLTPGGSEVSITFNNGPSIHLNVWMPPILDEGNTAKLSNVNKPAF